MIVIVMIVDCVEIPEKSLERPHCCQEAHEGARAQLTNAAHKRQKMPQSGAKKVPERQQNCPNNSAPCGGLTTICWLDSWAKLLASFFGSEFNNLQQYRHNLFVGAEDTKYEIERRRKTQIFGAIEKRWLHSWEIHMHYMSGRVRFRPKFQIGSPLSEARHKGALRVRAPLRASSLQCVFTTRGCVFVLGKYTVEMLSPSECLWICFACQT